MSAMDSGSVMMTSSKPMAQATMCFSVPRSSSLTTRMGPPMSTAAATGIGEEGEEGARAEQRRSGQRTTTPRGRRPASRMLLCQQLRSTPHRTSARSLRAPGPFAPLGRSLVRPSHSTSWATGGSWRVFRALPGRLRAEPVLSVGESCAAQNSDSWADTPSPCRRLAPTRRAAQATVMRMGPPVRWPAPASRRTRPPRLPPPLPQPPPALTLWPWTCRALRPWSPPLP